MSASSVKSRELVPVRRMVVGEKALLDNVITARIQRGEVVQVHRSTALASGQLRLDMTLMEPRPRLLVRLRRRMLAVVWPDGEGKAARVVRSVLYVVGTGVAAGAGYAVYETVLFVIRAVEVTHRYWPALLVLALVALAAGGKHIAHFCSKCGRAL